MYLCGYRLFLEDWELGFHRYDTRTDLFGYYKTSDTHSGTSHWFHILWCKSFGLTLITINVKCKLIAFSPVLVFTCSSLLWNFSYYFDLKPRSSHYITTGWVMILNAVYSKALMDDRYSWEMDTNRDRNSDRNLESIYAFASWFSLSNQILGELSLYSVQREQETSDWYWASLACLNWKMCSQFVTCFTAESWLWFSRESVLHDGLRLQPE